MRRVAIGRISTLHGLNKWLMNVAVPDCLVAGIESLETGRTSLPGLDDRHVLAADAHCGAEEITTFILRDFPDAALSPYGFRAIHPDVFVEHLLDLNTEAVCDAIRRIRRRLVNPAVSAAGLVTNYERRGLDVSASKLRSFEHSL